MSVSFVPPAMKMSLERNAPELGLSDTGSRRIVRLDGSNGMDKMWSNGSGIRRGNELGIEYVPVGFQ